MATTTNYGWDTPDDTDLVKDGAAAIRTLGSSVDTTTKALNPSTTLGDIEYRSATADTNTRLGIGTTGQVLTVTGGVPAWETASGATADWTLLNAGGTALTGATTITVSGISGQSQLMIIVRGASSANALSEMSLRLNADTASNYIQVGMKLTNSADTYQNLSQTAFSLGKQDNNANGKLVAGMWLSGTNSTNIKVGHQLGFGENFGSAQQEGFLTYNTYAGSSTISSVSIISSTGNFDAGTIFVYGSAV
jgi:hypothetical protein